ncbi:MAG: nucleotide exchange factor GrpE [Cyclobacteriaceae bacterium]
MAAKKIEKEEVVEKEVVEETTAETSETPQEEVQEEIKLSEEERLTAELAEQKDKFLRLYSEFENFRRRTAKEKIDLIATASEKVILNLLPVLDDFERAQPSLEAAEDPKAIAEGMTLIQEKLKKTLENEGLKPIEAKGETFDAELHEGITQIPAPSEDMKGKVVDEIEKGYHLGEKVIRYAKVVIGA